MRALLTAFFGVMLPVAGQAASPTVPVSPTEISPSVVSSTPVQPAGSQLSLEDAFAQALRNNPALQANASRLQAQQARVRGQYGTFLPEVRATGSWGVNDEGDAAPQTSTHPNTQALTLSQPLTFGEEAANLAAQRARRDSSAAGVAQSRQATLLAVSEAYSGVLVQQAAAESAQFLIEALQSAEADAQIRFKNGESTRTDVALATARLMQAKAQLAQARGGLDVQQQRLGALLGAALEPSTSLVWPVVPNLNNRALTVERHPLLLAARANVRAGQSAAWGEAMRVLPEVSAQAQAARAEETAGRTQGPIDSRSLTVNVSVPLFSGGQNLAAWQAARAEARAEAYSARDIETQLQAELAGAQATYAAAVLAREAAQQNHLAQTDATKGVRLEHKIGTRSMTDLLDAEQALRQSALNLAQARQAELVAAYSLLAAGGALLEPASSQEP